MDPTPFQPYSNPLYQPAAPWANANTYAPFQTPNGQTGSNPSFGGYGGETGSTSYDKAFALAPYTLGQSLWGLPFGAYGNKKRASPNFTAPSYQGQLFTPQEGLPQWYGTSAEGSMSDAALQSMMNPAPTANAASPSQPQSQDGFGSMPSYIGQMPWMGQTANNYAPNFGSSYGGYGTYGGYGNSANTGSTSKPYVPGAMAGIGQY